MPIKMNILKKRWGLLKNLKTKKVVDQELWLPKWDKMVMIVGVPLFAVIYDVIKKLVIHGLKRNKEIDLLQTYHDNFGDPEDDVPVETSASEAPPAETNNL
jgi:hypothetical protein